MSGWLDFFTPAKATASLTNGITTGRKSRANHPGKGIVVLSAHFGNFELLACAHAMHGHQISLVHHTQRFLAGDALMTFARERCWR